MNGLNYDNLSTTRIVPNGDLDENASTSAKKVIFGSPSILGLFVRRFL